MSISAEETEGGRRKACETTARPAATTAVVVNMVLLTVRIKNCGF